MAECDADYMAQNRCGMANSLRSGNVPCIIRIMARLAECIRPMGGFPRMHNVTANLQLENDVSNISQCPACSSYSVQQ